MALKYFKPVTPGLRGKISLVKKAHVHSGVKSLLVPLKGHSGRSHGRVSVRGRSRGTKKLYRIIDFKRDKYEIEGTVSAIEYDPNRGSSIALIFYMDGEKRYILCPKGLKVGDRVLSSLKKFEKASVGFSSQLKNLPIGAQIHNIELHPGRGGEIARSAGSYAILTACEQSYANIKMPSGEVKRINASCMATLGALDNEDLKNINYGKAGIKKYLGRRPKVRGVARSNPSEHPHGGSYKTSGVGRKSPVSQWGQPSKGYKTRRRKHTDKYIVSRKRRK